MVIDWLLFCGLCDNVFLQDFPTVDSFLAGSGKTAISYVSLLLFFMAYLYHRQLKYHRKCPWSVSDWINHLHHPFWDLIKQNVCTLLSFILIQLCCQSYTSISLFDSRRWLPTAQRRWISWVLEDQACAPQGQGPLHLVIDILYECLNSSGCPTLRDRSSQLCGSLSDYSILATNPSG